MDRFVYIAPVDIYDENVFTHKRINEWKNHLLDSYEDVFKGLKNRINSNFPIKFSLSKSLLDEIIIDAVIDMRKITDSHFNSIEDPNSFKIAAYLSYWWLRHKPISVLYSNSKGLEDIELSEQYAGNDEEYSKQKLIWQLKHVNELVAVQIVCTYIFDFDTVLCGKVKCALIKRKEGERFCFEDFDEMKDVILKKLTYYFAYRTITPKTIEHILEGYTFHPAWGLTGPQWNIDDQKEFR